jgi:hypothetical protein
MSGIIGFIIGLVCGILLGLICAIVGGDDNDVH